MKKISLEDSDGYHWGLIYCAFACTLINSDSLLFCTFVRLLWRQRYFTDELLQRSALSVPLRANLILSAEGVSSQNCAVKSRNPSTVQMANASKLRSFACESARRRCGRNITSLVVAPFWNRQHSMCCLKTQKNTCFHCWRIAFALAFAGSYRRYYKTFTRRCLFARFIKCGARH